MRKWDLLQLFKSRFSIILFSHKIGTNFISQFKASETHGSIIHQLRILWTSTCIPSRASWLNLHISAPTHFDISLIRVKNSSSEFTLHIESSLADRLALMWFSYTLNKGTVLYPIPQIHDMTYILYRKDYNWFPVPEFSSMSIDVHIHSYLSRFATFSLLTVVIFNSFWGYLPITIRQFP